MKIAVIGGSGFVGSRLINLLKKDENKFDIKNIDIRQSNFSPEITVLGDVTNAEKMVEETKGCDCVVLLAAQHRDDVSPISLYYSTNVDGMKNTLEAVAKNSIKRLIFYSSVAIYGLGTDNPDESAVPHPFNHYGKSKLQAENVLNEWRKKHQDTIITIIRPCVIFGERNRGNVYNLLNQISGGKFLMVGSGNNRKSMAYVENIVAFTKFILENQKNNFEVFNYTDKPDISMIDLVEHVRNCLGKKCSHISIPYSIGILAGYCFDLIAKITGKKLVVSSIRVKKFCANSQICSDKVLASGFKAPYSIEEGLKRTIEFEWIHPKPDENIFKTVVAEKPSESFRIVEKTKKRHK